MKVKKKIRVLVVEDSLLFRETIIRGLSSDDSIEIVASAADPYSARDRIIEFEPDVMTLDVELPRMNGIEFLKKLMPQYPLPVVVVSAVTGNVFEALKAGAVDFVSKPDRSSNVSLESFINELIIKIKIASTAKVGHWKKELDNHRMLRDVNRNNSIELIAIGSSTGGTEALYEILRDLPRNMPGIVIVQHMPPIFTRMFAERLNNSCLLEVKEAQTGDIVKNGRVLIAPGDQHMRIVKAGDILKIDCFQDGKVNGHCPSVDVLFNSIAEATGGKSVGIILTGMGYDGAKGLLNMRSKGAKTIGQDEKTSVVYGMPKVAYEIGAVEVRTHLANISRVLYSIINEDKL